MIGLLLIGTLILIVLLGLFIFFIVLRFKEKEEPTDDTLFIHFMPQYTHGYHMGVIEKVYYGEKRTGILFFPRDIDHVRIFKAKKKENLRVVIKPELIFIDNRKLIHLPKNSGLSGERNEIWGLPPNPEDFSELFKQHPMGKMMMQMVNEKNAITTEVECIRDGIERMRNIYRRQGYGELSRKEIDRMEGLFNDQLKIITKQDKDKRLGPMSGISRPSIL